MFAISDVCSIDHADVGGGILGLPNRVTTYAEGPTIKGATEGGTYDVDDTTNGGE